MHSLTIPLVMEDTRALLAYADTQKAARTDIVGTVGYCMSGALRSTRRHIFPIASAAASIYGVQLATEVSIQPRFV